MSFHSSFFFGNIFFFFLERNSKAIKFFCCCWENCLRHRSYKWFFGYAINRPFKITKQSKSQELDWWRMPSEVCTRQHTTRFSYSPIYSHKYTHTHAQPTRRSTICEYVFVHYTRRLLRLVEWGKVSASWFKYRFDLRLSGEPNSGRFMTH